MADRRFHTGPKPGRNLGKYVLGDRVYIVRCVGQVLHFRPLYGRDDSVLKVRLADIPLLIAAQRIRTIET